MGDQIVYNDHGKRIIASCSRLNDLRLDALVIPAFPDLALQTTHDYMLEISSQQGEQDLVKLGMDFAKEYAKTHGSTEKQGMPFLVPSRSAHFVNGYTGPLAANLIYVVSIDIDEGRNSFCNEEVMRDSTRAVLETAALHGFSRIGIPLLGSSHIYDNPFDRRLDYVVFECYKHFEEGSSSIDEVFILIPHLGKPAVLPPKSSDGLN